MVETILLGLDALDSDIFRQYLEEDRLPTFSRSIDTGSLDWKGIDSYHTDDLEMPMTTQAWTCIYTGDDTDYHDAEENAWRKENIDFEADVPSTLFDDISQAGLTVHSWRMAMTWPARDINGWMISGFPSGQDDGIADSEVWGLDPAIIPSDYGEQQDRWVSVNTEDIEPYLQAEDRKFEISRELLKRTEEPDVLLWGTQLPDKIGHELTTWKETQENDIADHTDNRQAYRKIDELLQRVISEYDPSLVVGVSDHGFERKKGVHSMRATLFEWIDPDVDSMAAGETFNTVESILDFREYLCDRLGVERQPDEHRYRADTDSVVEITESEEENMREKLDHLGYL